MATLMDFRYKRKYEAPRGADGGGKHCTGKDGESFVIRVPRGTLIKDRETGKIIHDMSDNEPYIAAKGGKGGWGNSHFATPTRQAPRFAKSGLKGEEKEIILELKLLADVGLLGFPNVGKSTLLSRLSSARPKIANYHFTTLEPNLGIVYVDEGRSFAMADIPGIIEGASEGVGLGHDFLRHVERCRLLVHILDGSGSEGRDPIEDFETINGELAKYSEELASRPQIIVSNKADIQTDKDMKNRLADYAEKNGYKLFTISAATGEGLDKLKYAVWEELSKLPPIMVYEPEYIEPEEEDTGREIDVTQEDGVYYVTGKWIENLMGSVNFDDYESRMYFERVLKKAGVYEQLEAAGVAEGDTVDIYGFEFDYVL